jgi:hypothetical protein
VFLPPPVHPRFLMVEITLCRSSNKAPKTVIPSVLTRNLAGASEGLSSCRVVLKHSPLTSAARFLMNTFGMTALKNKDLHH